MNGLQLSLRRSLAELWHSGYGEEVRRAAIVAPLLLLAGFASAWFFPSAADDLIGFFMQSVDLSGLSEVSAHNAATLIFFNNLSAAFSAIVWGAVPYAYLSAFPLGFNFYLVGVVGAYYTREGYGLGLYLVGLLPHGIVELPTLVLFCAAGLYLCSLFTARLRGASDAPLLPRLSGVSTLFLCVILPLLAVSSLLEAYVTPWLLTRFF